MAEYLCEEDMSTGEYISRDLALRQLNATCSATSCDNYNGVRCRACAYADAMDFIEAIPAADVQPVNRWISCKDKMPEEYKTVLVYEKDYGVMIGELEKKFFDTQYFIARKSGLILRTTEVTHWQPLPEPPKQ